MNWLGAPEDIRFGASYLSVGQNLYTPDDISLSPPDPSDRPYAGFLYASRGAFWIDNDHIDSVELTVGIIGPSALGEEAQSLIHDLIDADDPKGWDHQLRDEPALNIAWERRWPEWKYATFDSVHARVMPHTSIALGNVYTHASAGLTMQILPRSARWQSTPLRVRPAVPGSGYFYAGEGRTSWSAFVGAELRAVGRNIFLDGNTFKDGPSVEKNRLVADISAGVSTAIGKTRIAYTLNWRSREFDGQADPQVFGALTLSRRF